MGITTIVWVILHTGEDGSYRQSQIFRQNKRCSTPLDSNPPIDEEMPLWTTTRQGYNPGPLQTMSLFTHTSDCLL